MRNKYRSKINPKYIALIIEVGLLLISTITFSILDGLNVKLNFIPIVIVSVVLIFALVLTLSLIRFDSLRDIRSSDVNKDNLPIYTDNTTLLGHDLKDESEKKERKD